MRELLTFGNTGARWSFERPFRRRWILDFFCPRARLAVEVDGGYHRHPDQQRRDAERDSELFVRGILTLRFTNDEVLDDGDRVLAEVTAEVQKRLAEPPPEKLYARARSLRRWY